MLFLQNEIYHWWLEVLKIRRYIRHPAGVPLKFSVESDPQQPDDIFSRAYRAFGLRDVSEGGLCFSSDYPVTPGSKITIEIPIQSPPFQARGVVAWCRPEAGAYAIGVQFSDESTRYSVRMVEQVCHIEHYRADVEQAEGRRLSSEEAAREWIERFAEEFPRYS